MPENNNTFVWVIVTFFFVLFIFFLFTKKSPCDIDRFGQDPSIRASSGWVAGPSGMYGYDPIDKFAHQIDEMYAQQRALGKAIGCDQVCHYSRGNECNACFYRNKKLLKELKINPALKERVLDVNPGMMNVISPLQSTPPTDDIGPEYFREGHYPYLIGYD